jgi:threonine/homoserine/homoserine lactone efflux protein
MMLLAYTAFAIGVASPGPSVLAVMGTAMAQGRARALALASGVVCGSLCWGLCAAFGLAALMERWSGALAVVKAIGGVYLLWMAWQAARAKCAAISASIFCCYALAFSTDAARRAYRAGERWVNAVLAGVFAYAGVRMLLASQAR